MILGYLSNPAFYYHRSGGQDRVIAENGQVFMVNSPPPLGVKSKDQFSFFAGLQILFVQ